MNEVEKTGNFDLFQGKEPQIDYVKCIGPRDGEDCPEGAVFKVPTDHQLKLGEVGLCDPCFARRSRVQVRLLRRDWRVL